MPITATLELRLRPGDLDAAYATVRDMLATTRAFAGCQGVEMLTDLADPTHVVVVEHWESEEADTAYRAWRATPEGQSELRVLPDLLAGAPAITKYSVWEV